MLAKVWKPIRSLGVGASALALSACITQVNAGPTTVNAVAGTDTSTGTSTSGPSNLVCNPLGTGSTGTSRDQGLTGELYYLSPTGIHYDNVAAYIANGTKLDASLFFDQVNVPTRPFDAGFFTTDGQLVETPDGNKLFEWFAVRFNSVLRLTNNDRPTQYQFAVIADDGAVLSADFGNGLQTIVNNDGTHATKLMVSQTPITLTGSDALPIRLDYYQGPRNQIAVMLLWREWPANGDGSEPFAGIENVYEFFNPDYMPPVPEQNYQTLLSRGWKVIPPENFFLPSSAVENPCPVATATSTVSSTNTGTSVSSGTDSGTSTVSGTNTSTGTDTGSSTVTSTSTSTSTGTASGTNSGTATSTGTSTSTSTTSSVNTTWTIQNFDGTTGPNIATLFWTTAGVPGSTTVYYGTSAATLNDIAYGAASPDGVHTINITGLAPSTVYYFQAISVDANGRTQQSSVITKMTKAP